MKASYINKVYRTRKGLLALCLLALLPFLTACDHIDEKDQLIKVDNPIPEPDEPDEPTYTVRTVLLEDFTGQRCVNCPTGTEVIEQMLTSEWGNRLIAVGIHSGPLGFKGNATTVGLATDLGDEYYNHWNLEYQPVGLINRGTPTAHTNWIAVVRQELGYVSEVMMELSAKLNNGQIDITVEEQALGGTYTGKIQVWVLEDGITALQSMPDGSVNRNYVHNHVLRTAVNGTWGADVTLTPGQTEQQTYSQAIDTKWNTANLSIVAFVYNDDGVEQAIKTKVE